MAAGLMIAVAGVYPAAASADDPDGLSIPGGETYSEPPQAGDATPAPANEDDPTPDAGDEGPGDEQAVADDAPPPPEAPADPGLAGEAGPEADSPAAPAPASPAPTPRTPPATNPAPPPAPPAPSTAAAPGLGRDPGPPPVATLAAPTPTRPAARPDAGPSPAPPGVRPPTRRTVRSTTPSPPPAVSAPAADHGAPVRAGADHRVAAGESLWAIASRIAGPGATAAQVARTVDEIWRLNSGRIASGSPDQIAVGELLVLPG